MRNSLLRTLVLSAALGAGLEPALADGQPRVRVTTSLGEIVLELNPDKAPATVENFLQYVRNGHYDGTIFHRVIDGFMVQGGGFSESFEQKAAPATVKNEADNGLKNDTGTVAMARTQDPHSASAQFFINVNDNDFLNHTAPTPRGWGYAVFGRVVEGMDVVNQIKGLKTGSGGIFPKDVPEPLVVIEKAVAE